MFLIIIGLILYITVFSKPSEPKEPEAPKEDAEESRAPKEDSKDAEEPKEPKEVDPNGNVLRGYTSANLVHDTQFRLKGDSMADCRAKAKQYGYVAVGHRTSEQPNSTLKNTCFFYTETEPRWTGNKRDLIHLSGCTDASKKWPDCGDGGAIPGWTRSNLVNAIDVRAANIDECREKAANLDYIGVGYRTSEHSNMKLKDTCFYYDGTDANFKGNAKDAENVTACTDAKKTWPDC